MYLGLEIIDFHTHFPTQKPWFTDMGPDIRQQYLERRGERRAKIAREQAMKYSQQWRMTWGYDPPEKNTFTDEEQADKWAAEVDKYGLRAVGFVTGGGNKNLAKVIQRHPDKFVGFAHHYPFAEGAAEELRRAITEDGMKGYKLLAPMLDRPIEDEDAYPVWEVCAEFDIPVLIHFGIQGGGGGIAWHENINPSNYTMSPKTSLMSPLLFHILVVHGYARLYNYVGHVPMCRLTPADQINGCAGLTATGRQKNYSANIWKP